MPTLLVLTQTHNIWGGIEVWMADVFPFIESEGWTIHYGLAVGRNFNNPKSFLSQHTYMRRTHLLDGRAGTPAARQNAIRKLLERIRPDVVIPLAVGDALPALRVARVGGLMTRILVPVHSLHSGTLADIIENKDLIDMVGVVSGLLNRWGSTQFKYEPSRLRWIRNGVPAANSERKNIKSNLLRVGYVGRLENKVKRAIDVALIVEKALNKGVILRLDIVGDGPARGEIESIIRSVSGWSEFLMHGYLDRVNIYGNVFPNIDCILLTSVSEAGTSLAVIEAMQYGIVPVVSNYQGCLAEDFFHEGINCLKFPVGDTDCAARQLKKLADDRDLYNRLSEAARESVKSLYTRKNMLTGWVDALNDLACFSEKKIKNSMSHSYHSYGRLDRWGVPEFVSNLIRRFRCVNFSHLNGFDEWPGSLCADGKLIRIVEEELSLIDY